MKTGPSRILVAVDGSDYSARAAEYAVALAKSTGAELLALNVVDMTSVYRMLPLSTRKELVKLGRREAQQILDAVILLAAESAVKVEPEIIESSRSVSDSLLAYAKEKKADLIVVGTKGCSGIKKALLGSVATKVVTYASCPVLVVR